MTSFVVLVATAALPSLSYRQAATGSQTVDAVFTANSRMKLPRL